jgi:hypothetical protein
MSTTRFSVKRKAPIVATIVSGLTMMAVGVPQWIKPRAELPVLVTAVPKGAKITSQDVRWTEANAIVPYRLPPHGAWAANSLSAGEILGKADTTNEAPSKAKVLVEVSPTQSADMDVERSASAVEVVIVSRGRVIWDSGWCSIVNPSSSLLSAGPSSLGVWMTPLAAMGYETKEGEGTVSIIGFNP